MQKLTGKCLCEAITYEVNGELGPIFNCHCSKCRRWHGALFRTRAAVATKDFRWLKGEDKLSRYHSSDNVVKTFCSICGSSLISYYENNPDFIGLPLGGLEQAINNTVEGHIFVASKSPLYEINDNLPQYTEWPSGGAAVVTFSK